MPRRPLFASLVLSLGASIAAPAHAEHAARGGDAEDASNAIVTDSPLDRYTAHRDASFAWSLVKAYEGQGVKGYALDLTSQTWRDADEVSHPAWTHMVQIVVPAPVGEGGAALDAALPETALLFIGGNTRRDSPPRALDWMLAQMALATNSVVVMVPNVPNQPMVLNNDGDRRYEDDLLAETWTTAAREEDPTWIIHLAMVESAVASMDAAQAFLATDKGGNIGITGFVVSGASKRGWTSWLTAAVDERIRGVIPLVIDVMNLPKMIGHHWGAYGFWAPAIGDYAGRQLFNWLGSPESRTLREVVDPYLYRDRYTMPKFILNAAGDEYFLPDTTRYFLDDLPGLTRLRVVPNADHAIDQNYDAVASALGFHAAVINNRPIPELAWAVAADDRGKMTVTSDAAPEQVRLWTATNPNARDFRREEIGDIWTWTDLEAGENGAYAVAVETPDTGFVAYLVEARFRIDGQALPLVFSTEVMVLPDVLPFADKAME